MNLRRLKRVYAKAFLAGILSVAVFPGFARGQVVPGGQAPGAAKKEPSRALDPAALRSLKRSLFVPGWGQAGERHYLEAVLFFGAEVSCLAGLLVNNHRGNENYALYKKAATTEDAVRYRALTERYDRRRNQFILAAGAVWAVNLLDVYFIVKARGDKNERKAETISVRIETGENPQLAVCFRLGF
jgi:hypothetical protein